ncbi:bifunctional DNA primase/polymerase [Phenylobacterium sp.]|uniref:bifunctional DNA primase/polymerase n=1 Tax=Phenylobacterium sp. TaxID=1871053 RepID=UPI0035AF8DB5
MSNEHVEHAAPERKATPSFEPQQLEAYAGTGYELIPLHAPDAVDQKGRPIGKAPFKGWRQDPPISTEDAHAHMQRGANVGVRLRDVDLVLDVDPRNFEDGDDPLARLQKDLDFDLGNYPTVITGSGGKHIYMLKPADMLLSETLKEYPGIEFKTLGRQVVAAGSVHPGTRLPYRWDDDVLAVPLSAVRSAPSSLMDVARRPSVTSTSGGGEHTPEELAAMLDGLDVTQFRDQARWLEIMMASHHATAGDGRQEFIAWSTGDPQYSDAAWIIGRRWDSLHADSAGRRVTVKTLFKALVDAGRADLLPRDSAEHDFPDEALQEVSRKLADEYAWVVDAECFVRRRDTKKFSAAQFKSFKGGYWPDGDILSAIWKDRLPIEKFESLVYLPDQPEHVANPYGGRLYNIWRDTSVKPRAGDVTIFMEHMAYLFPNERERGYVLDYLSLLVRRPSEKIHFALLVRGANGTGKSWLGRLVGQIVGEPNISRPSNSVVSETYTGWQEGAQIAVLEELMTLGRQEIANRLKPVITDPYLTIRELYGRAYNIPNHLNLICFTNYADALPIEKDDRRWLVVFSPAEKKDAAYYESLFAFLDGDGPAAVADFLSKREVALSPKGVAPTTAGKEEMKSLSQGEPEQYLASLLEEQVYPFDAELVRIEDVLGAIPTSIANRTRNLQHRVRNWLQNEAKAIKHERYKKQDRSGRTSSFLWSLTNHDHWAAVSAAARADAFAEGRFTTS